MRPQPRFTGRRPISSYQAHNSISGSGRSILYVINFYVNIMWVCPIINAPAGRLLGAYDLGVATPRAVVHVGDKALHLTPHPSHPYREWETRVTKQLCTTVEDIV
ncbi:hypothetical protein Tco_1501049 [Tanacetum coccineum]